MSMQLDPVGNISLILQIVILFLLIIGLPFFRTPRDQKNLTLHGYFTIAALVLHTVLILIVMIPSFTNGLPDLGEADLFTSFTVWSHIILGTAAEALGIVIIGFWLGRGPKKMACWKMKRWMLPTFVIWVLSIINGTLIHILGLL